MHVARPLFQWRTCFLITCLWIKFRYTPHGKYFDRLQLRWDTIQSDWIEHSFVLVYYRLVIKRQITCFLDWLVLQTTTWMGPVVSFLTGIVCVDRAVFFFIWVSHKISDFASTTFNDLLKKPASLCHLIRNKTKTNRVSSANVFARFMITTCNYIQFWLVHRNVCGVLWFWF